MSNQIYYEARALAATGNAFIAIGIARQVNARAASMEMDNAVRIRPFLLISRIATKDEP